MARLGHRDHGVPAQLSEERKLREEHAVDLVEATEERRDAGGVGIDLLPIPLLLRVDALDRVELEEDRERREPELVVVNGLEALAEGVDVLERERVLVVRPDGVGDAAVDADDRVVLERLDEARLAVALEDTRDLRARLGEVDVVEDAVAVDEIELAVLRRDAVAGHDARLDRDPVVLREALRGAEHAGRDVDRGDVRAELREVNPRFCGAAAVVEEPLALHVAELLEDVPILDRGRGGERLVDEGRLGVDLRGPAVVEFRFLPAAFLVGARERHRAAS